MFDILKIFHQLIVEYREPDAILEMVKEEKKDFCLLLDEFETKLTKDQQKTFQNLNEQAVKVLYHELKKYYFLGYDNAKKSDV